MFLFAYNTNLYFQLRLHEYKNEQVHKDKRMVDKLEHMNIFLEQRKIR
jgi:Ca2+/H+ antiporter